MLKTAFSCLTDLSPQPTLLTILDEGLLLLVGSVLPDQAGGPDHPAQQLQGGEGLGAGGAVHLYTPLYCTVHLYCTAPGASAGDRAGPCWPQPAPGSPSASRA